MKKILVVMVVVFLAGCATGGWKKSMPEEYKDAANKFSVFLPMDWMHVTGKTFIMTKDGVVLDMVLVERVRFTDKLANTKKHFTRSMLPDELAGVEIDNYSSSQENQKFEVIDKQAETCAGQDAYRLAFRYQTKSGLWKKGLQYGFIYDGVVYRIVYEAAEQYYYQDNERAFKKFVEDFRLI